MPWQWAPPFFSWAVTRAIWSAGEAVRWREAQGLGAWWASTRSGRAAFATRCRAALTSPPRRTADGFIDICLNDYRGMVACAVWYAWADTMHNGYGLVRSDSSPRQPLYNHFLGF